LIELSIAKKDFGSEPAARHTSAPSGSVWLATVRVPLLHKCPYGRRTEDVIYSVTFYD
jgi:hypothetical protein